MTTFFLGVTSEWAVWVDTLAMAEDGSTTFVMVSPDRTANGTLSPTALSTFADITRIVARFE